MNRLLEKTPYLVPHPQSQCYWFRRRIPKNLQVPLQQTEVKVSLKTYELQEAVRRCRVVASQVDDIFCKVRQRLGAPDHDPICVRDALKHVQDGFEDPEAFSQPLEKWMIPSLLKRYSEASLAGYELQRSALMPAPLTSAERADPVKRAAQEKAEDEAYAELQQQTSEFQEYLSQLEKAKVLGRLSVIEDAAQAGLYGEKINPDLSDPAVVEQYKFQLLLKEIEAVKELIAVNSGADIKAPEHQTPLVDETDTWESYLEQWQKRHKPRQKSYDATVRTLDEWRALHGNLFISQITVAHVKEWKRHLEEKNLNIQTVKKKLALLRAPISSVMLHGISKLEVNPFSKVPVIMTKNEARQAADARQPFENEHLRALFKTPVFTRGERPAKGGYEAAFWIPLIGLFTGARLEEIGQLSVEDVITQKNRLWLRFTEVGETQQVKSEASNRRVPVHKELLKIGFEAYVNRMRNEGQERLFPHLRLNKYNQYTATFSTWFNEYFDKHVTDDSRFNFHSFRHKMKDIGIDCSVQEAALDNLMGHALAGMTNRYGRKVLGRRKLSDEVLLRAVDQIKLDDVDLSHLYVMTEPS